MAKKKMESCEETLLVPLRSLITSILSLVNAEKPLISFYKSVETIRFIVLSCYLLFIRFIPSFFIHSFVPFLLRALKYDAVKSTSLKYVYDTRAPQNDTGVGRALSQLLCILNDIPVGSRKYEVVRSLAEKIIGDNLDEGVHALREVNRLVLSAAFERALRQLQAVAVEVEGEAENNRLTRVFRAVQRMRRGEEGSFCGVHAEKLAAELLWLAQKLAACGCADEAVRRWAAASDLGFLSLTADPRLQTSLLKLSAFLLKEAKDMGVDEIEESKMKQHMQVKLNMLQSWLPLLCRASNGTDVPALTISERGELERVLEDIIQGLEKDKQEQVLSLWLHHFTHCPSSDWPNLHACFARWCNASRKQLLLQ